MKYKAILILASVLFILDKASALVLGDEYDENVNVIAEVVVITAGFTLLSPNISDKDEAILEAFPD